MKKTLLVLSLLFAVMLVAAPGVLAQEAEFETTRVVLATEGVYLEGDNGPTVIYLGFNGVGLGYRHYVEADTFVLARGGLGNIGLNVGLFVGKDFVYEGYALDARVGLLFADGGPRFALGVAVKF